MTAVFDTNIVIDALNGRAEADEEYLCFDAVAINHIGWMEVMVGAQDAAQVRDFLASRFTVLPIDGAVAEMAVVLRREYEMKLPDATVWATAKINNAVLVSRNSRDFRPEWDGIRVPY